ncbi:MAG TPA: hypothetical protein VL120_16630 [Solirubrobacteraceae bacterium]|nr:hypothetical protein [Solirubrobacteraceae bacterium]
MLGICSSSVGDPLADLSDRERRRSWARWCVLCPQALHRRVIGRRIEIRRTPDRVPRTRWRRVRRGLAARQPGTAKGRESNYREADMAEQATEMTGDGNQPEGTGWAPPDTGAGDSAESEIPVGVDAIEHTASPDDDAGDTEGGTPTIDVSAIPDVEGATAREDIETGDAGEGGDEAEAAAEADTSGEADAEGGDDMADAEPAAAEAEAPA